MLARMNLADVDFHALPVSERLQLVTDIWDSIAAETPGDFTLSEADDAELRRRLAAHEAEPSSSVPWEQVRTRLFAGRA